MASLPVESVDITVESRANTDGDRKNVRGELVDEAALIEAILAGKHGIPADVLTVKQAKLNEYARTLGPLIDRWPGVRYRTSTTIV